MEVACSPAEEGKSLLHNDEINDEIKRLKVKNDEQAKLIEQKNHTIAELMKELENLKEEQHLNAELSVAGESSETLVSTPKKRPRELEVQDSMNPNEQQDAEEKVIEKKSEQNPKSRLRRKLNLVLKKMSTYVHGYNMGIWRIKSFISTMKKICNLVKGMAKDDEVIRCSNQYATILDCGFVEPGNCVSENVSEPYF